MPEALSPLLVPPLAATFAPLLTGNDGDQMRAAMDRIAELGFRFVQLSATHPGLRPRDLDHSARRDLLATFRRRELTISGLDVWIPPRHFLEPEHSDRAVTALHQAIELAADLGRCTVSFTLPYASPASDEHGDALKLLAEAVSAQADRYGVCVADHAVPIVSREGTLIELGIDPAAWIGQGDDPVKAVLTNGTRLASARLCDLLTSGLRGPIGDPQERQLDVQGYKVALSVAGYVQPLIVDTRSWRDGWQGLEQTKRVWGE
jgi:sugar phosphate isomerase/epimerase